MQHGRDPAHTKPVQQQHVESKLDSLLWKVVSLGETNCAEKGLCRRVTVNSFVATHLNLPSRASVI